MTTIQEKVNNGVALLDEKVPGWRSHVDPDRFDMKTVRHGLAANGCVLAQLNYAGVLGARGVYGGSYYNALEALFGEKCGSQTEDNGFSLSPYYSENWVELNTAWQHAIRND